MKCRGIVITPQRQQRAAVVSQSWMRSHGDPSSIAFPSLLHASVLLLKLGPRHGGQLASVRCAIEGRTDGRTTLPINSCCASPENVVQGSTMSSRATITIIIITGVLADGKRKEKQWQSFPLNFWFLKNCRRILFIENISF